MGPQGGAIDKTAFYAYYINIGPQFGPMNKEYSTMSDSELTITVPEAGGGISASAATRPTTLHPAEKSR